MHSRNLDLSLRLRWRNANGARQPYLLIDRTDEEPSAYYRVEAGRWVTRMGNPLIPELATVAEWLLSGTGR